MAVETEVTDQVTTENQDQIIDSDADNDPMLAALREEENGEGAEAGNGEGEEGGEGEEKPADTTDKGSPEAGKSAAVMVPKARLDTVIGQRDQLRDQNAYLQGIIDARKEMAKGSAPAQTDANSQAGQNGQPASTSKVEDPNATSISKLQDDKIALAQKYEDGEISLVDLRKQENVIDNQIREIDAKSVDERVEGAKQTAEKTVTAHTVAQHINSEALKIQANHPYVAEIDKLPPAIKDGIWKQIDQEAQLALAQNGINPSDGTVGTKLALMQMKAELTNKYGPQYTGVQITQPANQKSPQAKKREAKLELANQQAPTLQNMSVGTSESSELTEQQILAMTDDQLADLYERNPGLVEKAIGKTR